MIFTLSGRQPIDVLIDTLCNLKTYYMLHNEELDNDTHLEILRNILDLEIIIEKMESEQQCL